MIPVRHLYRAAIACTVLLVSACSTTAPSYPLNVSNVQALKASGAKSVAVGSVVAAPGANNGSIGLRAVTMSSPVGSYAAYLQQALTTDLKEAGLLDSAAPARVSATLLHNDISAGGMSTNSGMVEARFTVNKAGATVYDQVKRGSLTWDSHFVGDIAISRARDNYPNLVAALLRELYSDPAFVQSLQQ